MRKWAILATTLGALVLARPAPAPAATPAKAPAPARKAGLPLPEVKGWKLDNGLQVFYLGVHGAPIVTVQVFYHVGSKDEPADRRGTARMFEKLLGQGSAHVRADQHARMIAGLGGDTGVVTEWDMTAVRDTLPREHLDFAVQLEAERMRGLLIRKESVERERDLVKQEQRMRVESSPIARAIDEFTGVAFTRHPYAWGPAGVADEIGKLGPEELDRFYDRYYQPGNAALVVVGDVGEDDVRASAQKWFGGLARAEAPPRPADAAAEPAQTESRRAVGERPAQVGIVIGGYKIPAARHADIVPLKLVASMLTEGESSRIKQRIVHKDKIGVAAGGQLLALEHPGLFFVFAAYLKPEEAPRCEKAIAEEIAKLGGAGPSVKELDKAKNQLAARFVFGLESVDGLAQQIGRSWVNTGDGRAWLAEYDAIQAVSAADVARVVKTYLKPANQTLLVVSPQAGGGQ